MFSDNGAGRAVQDLSDLGHDDYSHLCQVYPTDDIIDLCPL